MVNLRGGNIAGQPSLDGDKYFSFSVRSGFWLSISL